ncbi:glycosyltransferase family 2 protein, partial [Candidatus Auribacterota bacterium]
MDKKKISIIVPVYYSEKTLDELMGNFKKLAEENSGYDLEYVFVDDGSGDGSYAKLQEIAGRSNNVKVLKLSKNFGSFVACLAGFSYASGDCAVIVSADMQEPPELITKLVAEWENGNDVAIAVRKSRNDSFSKVFFAKIYYWLFKLVGNKDMPPEGFDIALIDRKVINIIKDIKEKNTTLMGLILWVGFKRATVYYDRLSS